LAFTSLNPKSDISHSVTGIKQSKQNVASLRKYGTECCSSAEVLKSFENMQLYSRLVQHWDDWWWCL